MLIMIYRVWIERFLHFVDLEGLSKHVSQYFNKL